MNRIRLLILYTVVTLFLIAITATAGYFCLRQNIHVVNMKSNYATENLFAYLQKDTLVNAFQKAGASNRDIKESFWKKGIDLYWGNDSTLTQIAGNNELLRLAQEFPDQLGIDNVDKTLSLSIIQDADAEGYEAEFALVPVCLLNQLYIKGYLHP